MGPVFLGQSDADGWIEIIVAILIIGGSALASVAKWLIGKFTPDEAKGKGPAAARAEPRPRAGRPATATARPAPPRTRPAIERPGHRQPPRSSPAGPYAGAPIAQATPVPQPPIGSGGRPVKIPVPMSMPRTGGAPAARPLSTRPPSRAPAPPTPTGSASRKSHLGGGVAEHHLEAGVAEHHFEEHVHKRHLAAPVAQRHPRGLAVDLDPETAAPGWPDAELDAIRHPTVPALRRAILMNEILGPPVALRAPDDLLAIR